MNISTFLAPACSALLLAGCSIAQTSSDGERDAPMGIEHGETVSVVLRSYVGAEDNDLRSDAAQNSLEGCIGRAMSAVDRRLALGDANQPQLRYRVDLEVRITRSPSKWDGNSNGLATVALATWIESITFSGVVFDVKRQSTVGRLRASAYGDKGAGVAFILVIPVPIGFSSRTESNACSEFGRQLAKLLVDSSPVSSPDPALTPEGRNDYVNCVVNGRRQWAFRSQCN
jgi:hypothetical protein